MEDEYDPDETEDEVFRWAEQAEARGVVRFEDKASKRRWDEEVESKATYLLRLAKEALAASGCANALG